MLSNMNTTINHLIFTTSLQGRMLPYDVCKVVMRKAVNSVRWMAYLISVLLFANWVLFLFSRDQMSRRVMMYLMQNEPLFHLIYFLTATTAFPAWQADGSSGI